MNRVQTKMSRRQALGRAAGLALALGFRGQPAQAQSTAVQSWPTELRRLAPNVYGYIQAGGPGVPSLSVSNAGVIVGDDHVLIVDSLGAPLHAKAFITAIRREVPTKPFGRLVLTHHHGDHIEGNQYFAPPAEIVGHEYCREAMLAAPPPRQPKWEKREGWADGTEDHRILPPVTTLTDKLTYHYGNMVVELIANAPAHTWGDVMVYLPQSKVLFAGDLAFHYVAPFAFNGHVTKWLAAVDRIMKMDVDVIVPGHGPIGGKKELAEMGQYFEILKSEARKRFDAGITAGRAAAEIKMGRFEQWLGAPERMVMNVHRLYQEFSGTLTPEADFPGMQAAAVEYGKIKGVPPRFF